MKKLYKTFSWIIGALLFISFFHILGLESVFSAFDALPLHVIFTWLLLTLLSRLISAEILYQPVKRLNGNMSRSDAFWLLWAKSFSNQIIPFSGLSIMLGFLRNKSSLSWEKISSLAWPQLFLAMQAVGLIGAYCSLTLIFENHSNHLSIFVFLAAFVFLSITPLIIHLLIKKERIRKHTNNETLKRLSLALNFLSDHKSITLYLLAGHVMSALIRVARLLLIFYFLGGSSDFTFLLLMAMIGEVAVLLNLTPGGLGIREGAIAIAAQVYGIDLDVALKAALLDRALIVLTTFVFGGTSLFLFFKKTA